MRSTPRPFDKSLGALIRARRLDAGMSQAILGRFLGITFQMIQKYEAGTCRVSSETLFRICNILTLDPTTLLSAANTTKGN